MLGLKRGRVCTNISQTHEEHGDRLGRSIGGICRVQLGRYFSRFASRHDCKDVEIVQGFRVGGFGDMDGTGQAPRPALFLDPCHRTVNAREYK